MNANLRALAVASAALLLACPSSKPVGGNKPVISSFSAAPASVAAGSASTLSWTVTDATSLSIDSGVGAVTGTSTVVTPAITTTYTLSASNASGSTVASATVTVTAAAPKPVIAAFAASPASIAPGASSTLSWSVTGATSLSIDNGVGSVTGTSTPVTPPLTATYTLTASNAAGSVTASATVTVTSVAPTIASFTATPAAIPLGASSTLAWSVSGAQSLSIDKGVGVVTGTSKTVSPAVTTTYKLTATAPGGATTSANATVTVNPPPVISAFTASPPSIAVGSSSTLSWTVTGATSLSIDQGIGTVTGTSKSVSPSIDTTYTLTATNAGGSSHASASVTVTGPPAILSFVATPASIPNPGSATLSWTVARATSLSIDQGVGPVTGTSTTVSPGVTTIYTLTATGTGTPATATATVHVVGLTYADPAAGGKVRLVLSSASPGTVTLDLRVGAGALTFFGAALNLALDPSRVTLVPGSGFDVSASALAPTVGGETAARAVVPTSGPLAGRLVMGVAHRKTSAIDLDQSLSAGALIARFTLTIGPGATQGSALDLASSTGTLLDASGVVVAGPADFAVGLLNVVEP